MAPTLYVLKRKRFKTRFKTLYVVPIPNLVDSDDVELMDTHTNVKRFLPASKASEPIYMHNLVAALPQFGCKKCHIQVVSDGEDVSIKLPHTAIIDTDVPLRNTSAVPTLRVRLVFAVTRKKVDQ